MTLATCRAALGVRHGVLFNPGDEGDGLAAGEGDRLALEAVLKPEQDVQHKARHSASTVAPATLAPRRHFVTLTGQPFLPVPRKSACRMQRGHHPQ